MLSHVTAGKPRRRILISSGRDIRFHFRPIIIIRGDSEFVAPGGGGGDSLIADTGEGIVADTGEDIVKNP
jgi:hypothetical protein